MKIVKLLWKLILGGAVTAAGWFLVQPELGATSPTVVTVIGIGLIAVGISVLAGVFD